VRGRE